MTARQKRPTLRLGVAPRRHPEAKPDASPTSDLKGVSWRKDRGRWQAGIRHQGKRRHLGYFDCPKEAHKAFLAAAAELRAEGA